jgi:hypothetical protein
MAANGPALRWLERMEALVSWRKPRLIGVVADGNKPLASQGLDELLKPFDVQPDDTVVVVKRFVCVDGLPRIASTP